jgi:hypothetical protein
MDSGLVAALLGAFVGAVAGGAKSLAGSTIINRMQLKRQVQIRIYDEQANDSILTIRAATYL